MEIILSVDANSIQKTFNKLLNENDHNFHFLDAVSLKVWSIMLEKFCYKFMETLLFENIGSNFVEKILKPGME